MGVVMYSNQVCPKCFRFITYIGTNAHPIMCSCNEGSERYKEGYRDGYKDGFAEKEKETIPTQGEPK